MDLPDSRHDLRSEAWRPSERLLSSAVFLLVSLMAAGVVAAPQDAADPAASEKPPEAPGSVASKPSRNPPIFFLRDGSKVAGMPELENLSVETRYGTLTIPKADIIRLRLAPRVDAEKGQLIESLVQQLGSEDFDEREAAMDALREMGAPALAALQSAKDSDDEETANRAEILVSEIETQVEEDDAAHGDEISSTTEGMDEVIARRFTIKGTIESSQFKINTKYGPLELKVADIVGVDFQSGGKVERSLDIAGSKTVPQNWVASKVTLQKGQPLALRASGNLFVQNYNLSCGAGGTTRYSGSTFKNFPQLSLVGRIGKKGKEFLVGENFKGKANATGVLYLGVVPFRRNYAATGSYKVKIVAGE